MSAMTIVHAPAPAPQAEAAPRAAPPSGPGSWSAAHVHCAMLAAAGGDVAESGHGWHARAPYPAAYEPGAHGRQSESAEDVEAL